MTDPRSTNQIGLTMRSLLRRTGRSTLIAMTEEAAHLVRTLSHHALLPERGGLRIVVNPMTRSLSMGLAAGPEHADAVIARDGALLFVCATAVERMHGRTLCAQLTPTGSAFFLEP
jgi:hypothetical protein